MNCERCGKVLEKGNYTCLKVIGSDNSIVSREYLCRTCWINELDPNKWCSPDSEKVLVSMTFKEISRSVSRIGLEACRKMLCMMGKSNDKAYRAFFVSRGNQSGIEISEMDRNFKSRSVFIPSECLFKLRDTLLQLFPTAERRMIYPTPFDETGQSGPKEPLR